MHYTAKQFPIGRFLRAITNLETAESSLKGEAQILRAGENEVDDTGHRRPCRSLDQIENSDPDEMEH